MADEPDCATRGEIEVEVIFCAGRSAHDSSVLRLPQGVSAAAAIAAAGILQRHPEIQGGEHRIGIWGRVVAGQQPLNDGDRVEIYRPLKVEPMEARRLRQRAQSARRIPKPA